MTALRVVIYGRKSKQDRKGSNAESITGQHDTGREWAAAHGHTVVAVLADNDSASGVAHAVELPDRDRAFAMIADGEADIVWVRWQSRLTREGWEDALALLQAGGRFYVHDRATDTAEFRDARGKLDLLRVLPFLIEGAADHQHSVRLSEHLTASRARGREAGRWPNVPPYGFTTTGPRGERRLTRDAGTWPVVERIYREASGGRSLRAIAASLNRDGIAPKRAGTRSAGGWTATAVHRVLQSPVYEGWQVSNRTGLYRDAHGQPVRVLPDGEGIAADVATRAREAVRTHRPTRYDGATRETWRLLAGLVRCAACGAAGVASSTSYGCSARRGGKPCDAPGTAPCTALEEYVSAAFVTRMSSLDLEDETDQALWAAFVHRWAAREAPEDTAALDAARARVADLEAREGRLIDMRADDLIDKAQFARRVEPVRRDLDAARADLAGLAAPAVGMFNPDQVADLFEAATRGERRAMLADAVAEIRVSRRNGPRDIRHEPFNGRRDVVIVWEGEQ